MTITLFLAFALQASPGWASLYKCVDAQGRTSYQGQPCEGQAGAKSQVEVDTRANAGPMKKTLANRRFLAQYNAYNLQKTVVDTCVGENSSFAEQISAAHERYYEHSREIIERGQEVFRRGFREFTSDEMRGAQREARAEKKIELRGLSRNAFDQLCREQADKFLRLVRGDFDKPSGYKKETAGGKSGN